MSCFSPFHLLDLLDRLVPCAAAVVVVVVCVERREPLSLSLRHSGSNSEMMKVVPVRIGAKYQAELPPLQTAQTDEQTPQDNGSSGTRGSRSTAATTLASSSPSTTQQRQSVLPLPAAVRYKQRWTPSRFTDDEVTEFLRSFCRLNEIELVRP